MWNLTDRWSERLICQCLALLLFCLGATAYGVEKIYYHVNDTSGSPAMIVESDGAVVARYAYAPFGSQVATQPAMAGQRLGFVGSIRETPGLHYLKHRYYNPQLGRFYQPDPVGFLERGISQTNRYAYGLNDPYRYQDSSGLSTYIREDGYVYNVFLDGDLSVYKLINTVDACLGAGVNIGKTLFIDGFISPDTNVGKGWIYEGMSIDRYIYGKFNAAKEDGLTALAIKSLKDGEYDVKNTFPGHEGKAYHGFLFMGNYISLREAGNILAGMNAASHNQSFDDFQRTAGALQGSPALIGAAKAGVTKMTGRAWGGCPQLW